MRTLLGILVALLVMVGVLFIGAYVYVSTGSYNVAADAPRPAWLTRLLEVTADNSIRRHARGIAVPDLEAPELQLVGFRHYDAMCAGCHGAPGVLPSEAGLGLSPNPPDLTRGIDLNAAEIYWVVRHGIDMTGMPSFGRTHDDVSLWAMTAFTVRLPQLSPMQYDSLRQIFRADTAAAEDHSH